MIADQDKETSDEQTLSEEKDRFDDEKGKKNSMGFSFQPYTAEHSCWNIKKNPLFATKYSSN